MKSKWYKYLVYASLVFLVIALYRADYLNIPIIYSWQSLILSFVFLFTGFIGQVFSWKAVLHESDIKVDTAYCLAGTGLSVFTKYIPGKVMLILGRAGYIAEKLSYPLSNLSMLSLNTQLIALWVGLSLGTIGLFLVGGIHIWKWLILSLWLVLTVLVFSKAALVITKKALKVLLNKDVKFTELNPKSVLKTLPYFAFYWLSMGFAFFLLIKALHPDPSSISITSSLCFPLVTTLGIMALIAPGGIGVREGLIVGYLVLTGIETADATTISVASRLWFLIGECFIFLTGWWADRRLKDVV